MAKQAKRYTLDQITSIIDGLMRDNMDDKAEYIEQVGWRKASKSQLNAYANYLVAYHKVLSALDKLATM